MKKLFVFLPVVMLLFFVLVGNRLLASGAVSPFTMIGFAAILFVITLLTKPKQKPLQAASALEEQIRGEFAKDAFADDPQLAAKFQAVLKDYSGNMPKSALAKLQKLAPLCTNDKDKYAVAMAGGILNTHLNKPRDAVREYVRALNIHQTGDVAIALGESYQRAGELKKAKDSYLFALDLEPDNTDARCKLATAYVADLEYTTALDHALTALDQDETLASALATAAICYGLLNNSAMCSHYTERAVEQGYKRDKITQTIDALRKRK